MRKVTLFIVYLFTILASLKGQDVKVTASFDTSRIWIGDQINYTVTVEQPADVYLTLKPLKDSLIKNIEILSGPVTDTVVLSGGKIRYTGRYLVTSFDSGMYRVPPYFAEIATADGIRRFHSGYTFLEVMRVKIAPPDTSAHIFDIMAPYRAPVTIGEILPWVLLAAAAGALVWGLIILLRRLRKEEKKIEIIETPDPAHIIAFRKLESLRDEQLWQKGEVKLYYSKLTEIIREYLDNRYGISSLEMTTSETLGALLKSGFRKEWVYDTLKKILTGSDLVKFAKYKPEPYENDQHFQDSWQFVDMTKHVDKVNEEKNGAEHKREIDS